MAKQNTAPDPVSAAMSAIESALNLTDDDNLGPTDTQPVAAPISTAKPVIMTPVLKPAAPSTEAAPLLRPSSAPLASAASEAETKPPLSPTPPANDDRETVGAILQAMNARPASRTPFILALIGSLLWAAICALYGYQNVWPALAAGPLKQTLLRPETPLLALAALGPILFMFGFAALSRRLRELRQAARAISQVAVRLAEPETSAGDHIATLSQAIRRELTSMGDGVERAISRAAELETRVKSEVSTLERSYSDSERRIRSLIAEMADQREAIVAGGGRVRDVIVDAHGGIVQDLDSAGLRLGERLTEAGRRIAASLGASSEEIVVAMDRTGSATVERLAAEGTQLAISIAGVGESVAARLADTSRKTADDILERVGDIDDRVKSAANALLFDMAGRSDDLIARMNDSQTSVVDAIGSHGDRVAARLAEAAVSVSRVVGVHADDVVGRINESSTRAVEAIRGHSHTAAEQLAEASLLMSNAIGAHTDEAVGRIRDSNVEVVDTIRL
ncbi:MAG: hypothetical protein WBY97_22850, partial [Roseiarcus sp.]